MIRSRRTGVLLVTLAALAAAALWAGSGCAVNPATGKRQINLVSSGREIEMGRSNFELLQQKIAATGRSDG